MYHLFQSNVAEEMFWKDFAYGRCALTNQTLFHPAFRHSYTRGGLKKAYTILAEGLQATKYIIKVESFIKFVWEPPDTN